MWPRTDLNDLLEIGHPVAQARMVGSTTSALAMAFSRANHSQLPTTEARRHNYAIKPQFGAEENQEHQCVHCSTIGLPLCSSRFAAAMSLDVGWHWE